MNPHHDLGQHKQKVTYSQKRHFCFFSLMKREKCIVNNDEWEIPNDNIASDSHSEEIEYTGN